MKKIIASVISREKRYAVLENGKLAKLEVLPPEHLSTVGNIYLGKVTKVLPGMEAAFVDYGAGKNGFLHRDKLPSFQQARREGREAAGIGSYVHQGEKIIVQVSRDEAGTKGARLTGLFELTAPSLVFIYGQDYTGVSKKFSNARLQQYWRELADRHKRPEEGLIIRTSMEGSSEAEFAARLESLRELAGTIIRKGAAMKKPGLLYARETFHGMLETEMASEPEGELYVDDGPLARELKKQFGESQQGWKIEYVPGPEDIFSKYQLKAAEEAALKRIAWLPNGGYLIIEETEAFTVIDVNTGKFTGRQEKEETLFTANLAAAREAARQMRLRNIAGIVLVDFINMEEEAHRKAIIQAFQDEVRKDEHHVKVVGFTELGILELTRKRTSPSLAEKQTVPCPVCEGTGRVIHPETAAFRLERELFEHRRQDGEAVWIETTESVAGALLGANGDYRPVLEGAIGKKLFITIIDAADNRFTIKRFGTEAAIREAVK